MTLDLADCRLSGPALPESFVRFDLPPLIEKLGLLPVHELGRNWESFRQGLRTLGHSAGPLSVSHHLLAPLAVCLGYAEPRRQEPVDTREGVEDGGWLLQSANVALRAWTLGVETDLDAPGRTGRAYRYSPLRCAQRVLLVQHERIGLLTNGQELRLLLCDPGRPDSYIAMRTTTWQTKTSAPGSFACLVALMSPRGIAALPDILEAARLSQARITRDLRVQARAAIEGFLQAVLDHPGNAARLAAFDRAVLPVTLWQQSLIVIYRLLFILKLESAADPARAFSFAIARLWREALSPNRALGTLVRRVLDHGCNTGSMLQDGLRTLFRAFRDGMACNELCIAPLGGALFESGSTGLLDQLAWSERGVAILLDRLLWTTPRGRPRERVQYGSLDVEELGRVYEALLELEPGIATGPMLRLRRARLEVVVPAEDRTRLKHEESTKTEEVERIPPGRFFLRAGFGRKATGAYYTPHEFVRFLVRETLAPRLAACSPHDDPDPGAILKIKVVDPATGSGHFLVEACRFLGDALYSAARLCEEQAGRAESEAARATGAARARLTQRAQSLRARLAALPDPDAALPAYLPGRSCSTGGCGMSEARALALCRRLVAVHCLYGVDRNVLAVTLAKVALWLESYAEGLPLTFLDHRLLVGDSVGGARFEHLAALPVSRKPLAGVVSFGVAERLQAAVARARCEVAALEASVGRDAADLVVKQAAKTRLDAILAPLCNLARVWSGAAMLADGAGDAAWLELARDVAETGTWPPTLTEHQAELFRCGASCLPWDLTFPEVFWPECGDGGFDAVLSNPPWDVLQYNTRDFLAGFDLRVLDAPSRREINTIERRLLSGAAIRGQFHAYKEAFFAQKRLAARLFRYQKVTVGQSLTAGNLDIFRLFCERMLELAGMHGAIGVLVPSAFHANEGATGLRQLYLDHARMECCFSFENRRKLFDIDSRFKFALIVARVPGPTETLRCAFYLDRIEQLEDPERVLLYDRQFIRLAGGAVDSFPELRSQRDMRIMRTMHLRSISFGGWCAAHGIGFGCDLHMTADSAHFVAVAATAGTGTCDLLPLHEGKSFHQFTDRWETVPRYGVSEEALRRMTTTQGASRYFRLAFRDIARSSDERTLIAAVLPPRVVCGHTANVERTPQRRANSTALLLCALLNSFPVDWLVRQRAAAHLSLFIMNGLPLPRIAGAAADQLIQGALRLCCNHAGYAPLWQELGGASAATWPIIADAADRWRIRAEMDGLVARAFGLSHGDYAHLLGSFSHKSFPEAPALCLAAFDRCAVRPANTSAECLQTASLPLPGKQPSRRAESALRV